jgi:hypothetical protein
MNNDFGPWFSGRAAYNVRSVPSQILNGGKVRDSPFLAWSWLSSRQLQLLLRCQIRRTSTDWQNALTKFPLANPGRLTQLGGEFILAPGYVCEFAHRMTNTSGEVSHNKLFPAALFRDHFAHTRSPRSPGYCPPSRLSSPYQERNDRSQAGRRAERGGPTHARGD